MKLCAVNRQTTGRWGTSLKFIGDERLKVLRYYQPPEQMRYVKLPISLAQTAGRISANGHGAVSKALEIDQVQEVEPLNRNEKG